VWSSLCCSKLSFEQTPLCVRGFDPGEPLHKRIRLLSWLEAMLSYREFGPLRPAANDFVGFAQMLQCFVVITILKILAACHIFLMTLDDFRVVRSIAVVYR